MIEYSSLSKWSGQEIRIRIAWLKTAPVDPWNGWLYVDGWYLSATKDVPNTFSFETEDIQLSWDEIPHITTGRFSHMVGDIVDGGIANQIMFEAMKKRVHVVAKNEINTLVRRTVRVR